MTKRKTAGGMTAFFSKLAMAAFSADSSEGCHA